MPAVLAWLLLLAQIQGPAVLPVTEDKEILAILDAAKGLPPEFAADVHLKLAASRLISTRAGKRRLIEVAFLWAAHAELPYPHQHPGAPAMHVPHSGTGQIISEGLTLQTRAVEAAESLQRTPLLVAALRA